jgi:hypothetical protein
VALGVLEQRTMFHSGLQSHAAPDELGGLLSAIVLDKHS